MRFLAPTFHEDPGEYHDADALLGATTSMASTLDAVRYASFFLCAVLYLSDIIVDWICKDHSFYFFYFRLLALVSQFKAFGLD